MSLLNEHGALQRPERAWKGNFLVFMYWLLIIIIIDDMLITEL